MKKTQAVCGKPTLLATLLLTLAAQAHAAGYAVVDVGSTSFSTPCYQCTVITYVNPVAINDSGLVLESLGEQVLYPRASTFANDTRVIDAATLQSLPLAYPQAGLIPNSGSGVARAINASNQIATGGSVVDATGSRSFTPPAGTVSTIMTGLNAGTQLTGYTYDAKNIPHGFVTASNLGTIKVLGTNVLPAAINAKGQVAGAILLSSNSDVAFLTTEKGSVVKIGKLLGDTSSRALAINDSGVAVGYSNNGNTYRAFITGLFSLPVNLNKVALPGYTATQALGINNAGTVVGIGTNAQGGAEPFVYQGSKLSRLNADAGVAASGWTLTAVQGINNKGQIVGIATSSAATDGYPHVVVLNPLP